MNNTNKIIGVYFLYDKDEIIYIGSSLNIIKRINTHRNQSTKLRKRMPFDFDGYSYIYCTPDKRVEVEKYWIKKIKPKYNTYYKEKITKDDIVVIKSQIDKIKHGRKNRVFEEYADKYNMGYHSFVNTYYKLCQKYCL